MSRSDPGMRLPSWLIAASLVVVVVATLTYFVTTSNDNTDEAAPSSETTSPSEAADSDKSFEPEKKSDPKPHDKSRDTTSKKQKNGADKPDPKSANKPDKKNSKKSKKANQAPQTPEPSPDATVDVYNNAGITDLAASVSGDVRAAGFTIGGVDNWYGAIPSTTVYYPPGMEEQAELLADSLGVSRMMPAVDPMSGERLSLVLTAAI